VFPLNIALVHELGANWRNSDELKCYETAMSAGWLAPARCTMINTIQNGVYESQTAEQDYISADLTVKINCRHVWNGKSCKIRTLHAV